MGEYTLLSISAYFVFEACSKCSRRKKEIPAKRHPNRFVYIHNQHHPAFDTFVSFGLICKRGSPVRAEASILRFILVLAFASFSNLPVFNLFLPTISYNLFPSILHAAIKVSGKKEKESMVHSRDGKVFLLCFSYLWHPCCFFCL